MDPSILAWQLYSCVRNVPERMYLKMSSWRLRGGDHRDRQHKVQRVEEHQHRLVPSKHDHHSVYPVRYLCDGRYSASLRFDKVRVCIPSEAGGEIKVFRFRENDK